MMISDLYDYLDFKQRLILNSLKLAPSLDKKMRRQLRSALDSYYKLEQDLDFLCESVYYFSLGREDK